MFEAIFRVAVQVETDEQGQRVFPVTRHRTPVNEAEFLSLLASVYQEEVYPRLRTDDTLTITVHLDLPLREVESAAAVTGGISHGRSSIRAHLQVL